MDIIKNPVIIGLFAGTLTYIYLSWTTDEKNKKKKNKHKKEEVNLLIPFIVCIIAWFIAYAYMENGEKTDESVITSSMLLNNNNPVGNIMGNNMTKRISMPLPVLPKPSYRFVKDVISESSSPKEFILMSGGVSIPTANSLPELDTFIDLH